MNRSRLSVSNFWNIGCLRAICWVFLGDLNGSAVLAIQELDADCVTDWRQALTRYNQIEFTSASPVCSVLTKRIYDGCLRRSLCCSFKPLKQHSEHQELCCLPLHYGSMCPTESTAVLRRWSQFPYARKPCSTYNYHWFSLPYFQQVYYKGSPSLTYQPRQG